MTDAEWKITQEVAASAARACDIVKAADELALRADRILEEDVESPWGHALREREDS